MGSFYRSKHELIFAWKHGTAPHINTFELGQHGRNRANVRDYAGLNTFGAKRMEELAMHPTVKPVALVADAIKDCSRRGEVVLDAFCGSGTLASVRTAASLSRTRGQGLRFCRTFHRTECEQSRSGRKATRSYAWPRSP